MKSYKYLSVLTGFFTATLIVTNVLNSKIFQFGSIYLPAGIVIFPLAFIFGDLLTEVYGYSATRKVIWIGFISLIFMAVGIQIGKILPPAPFWTGQQAYSSVLGQVPRIVIASMCAYFVGEFCNSYVIAKIKVRMSGKMLPFRFVASTIVGQAADTIVFILVAFVGVYQSPQLLALIFSSWVFKIVWEIIALPFTLPIVSALKKAESEDYYDKDTNFSPFHL